MNTPVPLGVSAVGNGLEAAGREGGMFRGGCAALAMVLPGSDERFHIRSAI